MSRRFTWGTALLVLALSCAKGTSPPGDEAADGGGGEAGGGARGGEGGNMASGGAAGAGGAVVMGGSGLEGGAAGAGGNGDGGAGVGGSGGAGAGGAGGDSQVMVLPEKVGSAYRFAFDEIVFEVQPETGGRVSKFARAGHNVLTGPSAHPDNWGATIWPSPQKFWNWPPPAELDSGPYTARVEGPVLILKSQVHAGTGLELEKRFEAKPPKMQQTSTLTNVSGATRAWGLWQVSRVPPDGLTFFGVGEGGTFTRGTWQPVPGEDGEGAHWITHRPMQLTKALKTFADGKGWLAHVLPTRRLMFLKTFADVPNGAWGSDEGEIEIFADGAGKYVEVEAQSAAKTLAQGQSLSWSISWQLVALPEGAEPIAKNAGLVQAAENARK